MKRLSVPWLMIGVSLFVLEYSSAIAQEDTSGQQTMTRSRSISVFPILMYDSDIGFGFGGKGVIKNQFRSNESYDLTLFGSTKGEQWYVFAFSVPDPVIRHGTAYPLAFDLKVEYDKILKSNFFGFGNDSRNNDWQFPREFTAIDLTVSHAFKKQLVGEVGLVYHHTSVYGYEGINSFMTSNVAGSGATLTSFLTAHLRLDTRDSQTNPHKGWQLGLRSDFASGSLGGDYDFQRYRIEVSRYWSVFPPAHILALRLGAQQVEGAAPYLEQSAIGGGWTARGFKADRFIDRSLVLTSTEYRFLIWRKLGGVLFADAGRVLSDIGKATFDNWKASWGWGLRYYATDFVVRLDFGMSGEGSRMFFNFGHVF